MDLAEQLLEQIADSTRSYNQRMQLRCQLAKDMEEIGDYEKAREAMGEVWRRIGEQPVLDHLDKATAAEVLLRTGVLTGWIGSVKQIKDAQEIAKELINKSIKIFASLQDAKKVAEARIDIAYCYWRQGKLRKARSVLQEVLSGLDENESYLKAVALLRKALVESTATRFSDSLRILMDNADLFETSKSVVLKGRFHNELAFALRNLGTAEHRQDYIDRALVEYTAASVHFEQAGHKRYNACVENNLGFLFFTLTRFTEAHEHLERARRLFVNLKDKLHIAQVDETRGRVLLAEGKNVEAEGVARGAVEVLVNGGEQSLLVEALTTYGTALARLGRHRKAREAFERAVEVGEQAGDGEKAGLAALALVEELGDRLGLKRLREVALRAGELLEKSQDVSIVGRSNLCLRWALRLVEGDVAAHGTASVQGRERVKEVSARSEEVGVEESGKESKTKGSWSWEGFSLWEDVRRYEERVIGRALRDAGGVVSRAAQMLGFKHHNSLIALLNTRHKNLLHARSPIIPRRRSIVRGGQSAGRVMAAAKWETRSVSVLHVEDNAIVADAVKETLEAEGWRVEGCADGVEALKLVESEARFDLLLVDCELPGLGGIEIVRAARRLQHRRETPIIILSASDCVMEAHRAGANVFLRKPEDIHALVETIAHLLNVGFKQH